MKRDAIATKIVTAVAASAKKKENERGFEANEKEEEEICVKKPSMALSPPAADEYDENKKSEQSIPTRNTFVSDHDKRNEKEDVTKEKVDVKAWMKNYKQQRIPNDPRGEQPTQLKDKDPPSKTSETVQDKTDTVQDKTDDVQDKTDTVQDKTDKVQDKTDTVQQERDPHKQCEQDVEISRRSNDEKTVKDNEEKNNQVKEETKADLKKEKQTEAAIVDLWKVRLHNFSIKS